MGCASTKGDSGVWSALSRTPRSRSVAAGEAESLGENQISDVALTGADGKIALPPELMSMPPNG